LAKISPPDIGALFPCAFPFCSWPPTHTRVAAKQTIMNVRGWGLVDCVKNGACFASWHSSEPK
jgi:hypothetical protein